MPVNLNSTKYDRYIRALLVGPTGRGKTIAASSWPGKTLILDFDDRHRPVLTWYPERVAAGDFTVESINPLNFWTVFKPLVNSIVQYNPYDNVILDGITSLSTTTIIMQMMVKGAFDNWFGKKSEGMNITAAGIMVPGWPEFNGEAMIIQTLLETLKSLKCNLFITAHPVARTEMGKDKKARKYTSLVTFGPKVESVISSGFDEMWFFDYKVETDNNGRELIKRTVYTQPSEDYFEAKTSLKLPKEIDYTDKNLYDCIKDYL